MNNHFRSFIYKSFEETLIYYKFLVPFTLLLFGSLCFTGVGVLNNLLYAVGGHDGPLVRKSVEVYDPATNTWRQVADMNMCRRNAGIYLVYDYKIYTELYSEYHCVFPLFFY